ncbi:MAG TPA: chemotaxis protein CheC [Bacillota bacterium]|nr:chemotaxis protein CheC [Bacillota bacterium]
MDELLCVTPLQKDILKEVSNIGAGCAATALAQLVKRKIVMTVPGVNIVPLVDVADSVGGADRKVVGIFLRAEGVAPCNLLFLLSIESAHLLVDMMLDRELGTTQVLEDFNLSALQEVGNMVAGAFMNALFQFTNLKFSPSVPAIAVDMAGAMLNTVLYQHGFAGDYALMIETEFAEQVRKISGSFFMFPDPGSLTTILSALGVAEHGECS